MSNHLHAIGRHNPAKKSGFPPKTSHNLDRVCSNHHPPAIYQQFTALLTFSAACSCGNARYHFSPFARTKCFKIAIQVIANPQLRSFNILSPRIGEKSRRKINCIDKSLSIISLSSTKNRVSSILVASLIPISYFSFF